ncbi:MAG TPA: transposase [Bryobacteraceae bacterium]|nr:transposase [Bryobacteraceae bacterium]
MDRRKQGPAGLASRPSARCGSKKNSAGILFQLDQLWNQCFPAFDQRRLAERAQTLSLSALLCLGRHTVTGLLTTSGSQFRDWSASYRLFSQNRLPVQDIFSVVRRAVVAGLAPNAPVCAVLDDSLLRRCGARTPGVAWRRDPLGPRFQTNFVRAQRFLQTSLALCAPDGSQRMVPVSFRHVPTPAKPSKRATESEWKQYRAQARAARISQRAAEQIRELRTALDADSPPAKRPLIVAFDGGYTNQTILKHIPANTTCIGRLRKDAHLLFVPDPASQKPRGRRLCYGSEAPTPEQIRTEDSPWETLRLSRHGVSHDLRFKRRAGLMWRAAGATQVLQLIVIAPLAYRLRTGSKLLYRDPAFLICTDPNLDPRLIIQTYFQRWDIEVNFREEKTVLGVGQAQVRSAHSVQDAPALTVASYAMLLIATQRAFAGSRDALLPRPKWATSSTDVRISTQQAIHQLRAEVWGRGLGLDHFSGFASTPRSDTNPEKCSFPVASAVCYANA